MHGHVTGLKQCPACAHPDETLDHLFYCRHPALVRARAQALQSVRQKGKSLHMLQIFVETFFGMLTTYFADEEYTIRRRNKRLNEAIEAQKLIGTQFLPRGFFAIHWYHALESLKCEHADWKLANFLFHIWTEVTNSIWTARNEIVHYGNNLSRQADESRIDRRLTWFYLNHREVLAHTDYRLVRFDIEALHTMTLASKRERLRQLEVAEATYKIEKQARDAGQQIITRFFVSKKIREEGITQVEAPDSGEESA